MKEKAEVVTRPRQLANEIFEWIKDTPDDETSRHHLAIILKSKGVSLSEPASLPQTERPSILDSPEKSAKKVDVLGDERAWALAKRFHTLYESLAPQFGYETREESAKPWESVPIANKQLMTAVCHFILKEIPMHWLNGAPADSSHNPQPCPCPCHDNLSELRAELCPACKQPENYRMESLPLSGRQHYHKAHYDGDKLTRECEVCGRDLMHESHIRG